MKKSRKSKRWLSPRVDVKTILRPKVEGGLGLIFVVDHTLAMAAKDLLWTVQEEDHTLQAIYRVKIGELSLRKWGIADFNWMVAPCRTLSIGEPALWTNHCIAWNIQKAQIVPPTPTNWKEKISLPLWTQHLLHKNQKTAACI